jgi:hypothetical protein
MSFFRLNTITTCLVFAITSLTAITTFAQPVNLYDQPKADSKVVGTIDSSSSMVPIFTAKDGLWMKIGDPKNGNVGWVKVSDFTSSNHSGFSFSQQVVNSGEGPKTTIQFGSPKPMTSDQIAAIEKRQLEAQKAIQKIMQDMYTNVYGAQAVQAAYPPGVVPIYMPVIMLPPAVVQAPAAKTGNTPPKN